MGDFSPLRPRKMNPLSARHLVRIAVTLGGTWKMTDAMRGQTPLSQGPFLPQERLPEMAKNYNNNSRLMMKCLLPLSYLPLLADSRAEEDCFSQQAICYGRIGITDKYRI